MSLVQIFWGLLTSGLTTFRFHLIEAKLEVHALTFPFGLSVHRQMNGSLDRTILQNIQEGYFGARFFSQCKPNV